MSLPFRLCALLGCVLLAACAPHAVRLKGDPAAVAAQLAREQALGSLDRFVLEGRLGVSDGKDGGSGSFSWTQRGASYEFELRGPAISGMSFRLSGGPGGALLEGLAQGPVAGRDAEALMRKALGWEVPLADLRAWVFGLRADGGPAELAFGADRLPSRLVQDGWTVDYPAWATDRDPALPKRVFASHATWKVKLSISAWCFD